MGFNKNVDYSSLNYYQGFYDAWMIIKNRWVRLKDKNQFNHFDIEKIYDEIIGPVREHEIVLYENMAAV